MKVLRFVCAFCALVLVFQVAAFAQAVTGTVLGTVTDPTGAVVANAKVNLTEVNTGVSRTILFQTSRKGRTRSQYKLLASRKRSGKAWP
jgi:hypothetical protein